VSDTIFAMFSFFPKPPRTTRQTAEDHRLKNTDVDVQIFKDDKFSLGEIKWSDYYHSPLFYVAKSLDFEHQQK
jgi:hypothetical protein